MSVATARRLGLVDRIVVEPRGGAHRDPASVIAALAEEIRSALATLTAMPGRLLVERRVERFRRAGDDDSHVVRSGPAARESAV